MTQNHAVVNGSTSIVSRPDTASDDTHIATILTFLQFLYRSFIRRGLVGYAEIALVNPDDKSGSFQSKWHKLATGGDLLTFAKRLHEANKYALSDQRLNVYVSHTLYKSPNRKNPLDTDLLFIDDVQPHEAWHGYIRTSPNSGHGYIRLNKPLATDERLLLQASVTAVHGGDASGVNVTKIVRVPSTHNTKAKYHEAFFCRLESLSERHSTITDLRRKYPEHHGMATINADAQAFLATLDMGYVALLNGNYAKFENAVLHRCKHSIHDRVKQFKAGIYVNYKTSESDSSTARYDFMRSLAMRGLPNEEIYTLVNRLIPAQRRKKQAWLDAEIARLIDKIRNGFYDTHGQWREPVVPREIKRTTFLSAKQQPHAPKPMAIDVAHRPSRITPQSYLTWLYNSADADQVMMSVRDCAEKLDVSQPTIERMERVLRQSGNIERVSYSGKRGTYIVVNNPQFSDNFTHQKSCKNHSVMGEIGDLAHQKACKNPKPIAVFAEYKAMKFENDSLINIYTCLINKITQPYADDTDTHVLHSVSGACGLISHDNNSPHVEGTETTWEDVKSFIGGLLGTDGKRKRAKSLVKAVRGGMGIDWSDAKIIAAINQARREQRVLGQYITKVKELDIQELNKELDTVRLANTKHAKSRMIGFYRAKLRIAQYEMNKRKPECPVDVQDGSGATIIQNPTEYIAVIDAPDDLLNQAADLVTCEKFTEYEKLKAEYPQFYFETDERHSYKKFRGLLDKPVFEMLGCPRIA